MNVITIGAAEILERLPEDVQKVLRERAVRDNRPVVEVMEDILKEKGRAMAEAERKPAA